MLVDVGVEGGFLVRRTGEVVGKAAGRADPGDFGDVLRATNGGDVGASTGELGCELEVVLVVVQ